MQSYYFSQVIFLFHMYLQFSFGIYRIKVKNIYILNFKLLKIYPKQTNIWIKIFISVKTPQSIIWDDLRAVTLKIQKLYEKCLRCRREHRTQTHWKWSQKACTLNLHYGDFFKGIPRILLQLQWDSTGFYYLQQHRNVFISIPNYKSP